MSETTAVDVVATPYAIAKTINAALKEAGLPAIPPQMMYNYDRAGLINGVKKAGRYNPAEVAAFVEKYLAKKLAK